MSVESNPSLIAALVINIAAVWAPSPPAPASLRLMSSGSRWAGNPVAWRSACSVVVPMAASVASASKAGVGISGYWRSVASFFTPSGNTCCMVSRTQPSASSGVMLRWIGHSDSTSMNAKPVPLACSSSAFLMARLAWVRRRLSYSATRSTNTGPSRPAIISATFNGSPANVVRPPGEVVVFCPRRVVGAIWPPVIP